MILSLDATSIPAVNPCAMHSYKANAEMGQGIGFKCTYFPQRTIYKQIHVYIKDSSFEETKHT